MAMDCETAKRNISAYLDRELEEKDCKEFMAHVDDCQDCRIALRSSKKSINLMQLVFQDSKPPGALKEKVYKRIKPE